MSQRDVMPSIAPGEEWVGALVTLPSYITGEGEPFRPVAVMWVDAASHFILDTELVRPDEALGRAAGLFVHATREPKHGPPHTPRRLRVNDATLAAALRGSIGDVELVIAPTPEIDEIVTAMTEHLTVQDPEEMTFIGPDMTSGDVATMFGAAARLYRAAPWTVVPPDVCIGVRCELLGIVDGAMVVVGQMGQSYGFSLFASMDAALDFYAAVEANERGERPDIPEHIMFSFDPREELPVEIVREVEHHGWEVAGGDAYPSPKVIDDERIARGLTRVEMLGASAIMTALAELVAAEPRLAEAWDREEAAITWNQQVQTPLGSVEVELRAPVPLPFESLLTDTDQLVDDNGDLDEDELAEYTEALLDELSRVPGIGEMHLRCADMLIVHAARAFGVPLLQATPQVLHQLVFEYVPAEMPIEPDMAPFVIDAARHVMTLAAERHGIETARQCITSLADPALPTRLARALADESRYSPAKAMLVQGIREGYDLTSEAGVSEWVAELSRRAQPRTRKAGGKKTNRARSKATPSAKRKPASHAKTSSKAKPKPKSKAKATKSTTKKTSSTRSKKSRSK